MNKNKFQNLCEQVLIPQIDEVVRRRTRSIQKTLDILARALAHIERKIDRLDPSNRGRE